VPRHVGKASREFDAAGDILGVERVRVLNVQVGVEELVGVFVRIRRRRLGETKVHAVLVARDDGVDRRVIPSADTVEAKFVLVIREGGSHFRGEELGRNLPNHGAHHTTVFRVARQRKADSPLSSFHGALPLPDQKYDEPYTVTPSTDAVDAGGRMSVSWTAPRPQPDDWLALFRVGGSYEDDWYGLINGEISGTRTLTAPTRRGQYEFRYLIDLNYRDIARSSPLTVMSPLTTFASRQLLVSYSRVRTSGQSASPNTSASNLNSFAPFCQASLGRPALMHV
jgi:hypothetical protein